MDAPVITRDLTNRTLTVRKEFQAPVSKVWEAWSVAEKLTRWWGPRDWPATSHAFEFREGGRWHFSMKGPKDEVVWGLLRYTRIVPFESLHAEDYFSDAQGTQTEEQHLSTWKANFEKVSATVTRVTTRLVCATEAKLQYLIDMGFEAGYTSALEILTEALEGRAEPQTLVSADGTKLVYEKLGKGPAVILVGGAMVTRDLPAHTELAAALSASFTVYNYDRRGRGDSGNTPPYSVDKEIDDLRALVAMAGGRAAVYGLSSGALLALRAAAAGVNLTRLALWEPPLIVEPGDRRPPADSLAVVTDLVARGKNAAAASYFMTRIFGMPAFVPWILRLTPHWKAAVRVAPSLPHDLAITADYSIPAGASQLTVPTLVLHGDHTQALLEHGARALAKAIPGARLQVLPGVNHQVATADLAPVLNAFFKGEDAR